MKTVVIATCSVNGFHAWPDAPIELAYLCARHRHSFYFKVSVRVGHDNRQVEFHQLQRAMRSAIDDLYPKGGNGNEYEFGAASCEMLATDLYTYLGKREWLVEAVEVWEDEECGARVTALNRFVGLLERDPDLTYNGIEYLEAHR